MACIRKRRGKWVVDYRDSAGIRRWTTCETRREAEAVLSEKVTESRQRHRPLVDANVTVARYAERWLGQVAAHVKAQTVAGYRTIVTRHLLPALGDKKVRDLDRGRVKEFLAGKLTDGGLTRSSVRIVHAVLRNLLNAAIDDGLLLGNPADKLGRALRLVQSPRVRQEAIKALDREQLDALLTAAWAPDERHRGDRRYAPLFLLLARTGVRIGEALVLQWDDLDLRKREMRVARTLSGRTIDTPKSGHGRTVDLSRGLCDVLRRLQVERKAETLRRGWREVPPWVFVSKAGTPLEPGKVAGAFRRALTRAGLPARFTPHSLRHSFASLLIAAGQSPVYVQRQLGHASIQLTVDTYGKWLPMGNKAAVDALDEGNGSKVVADAASALGNPLEMKGNRLTGSIVQ